MKLLVLLVVLALRRMDVSWPDWLAGTGRFQRLTSPLGSLAESLGASGLLDWILRVALPAVAIGLLVAALHSVLWGIAGWLAGGMLLLWLLGTESESRLVDDMLVRGRMNDPEGLAEVARESFGVEGEPGAADWFTTLSRNILSREAHHLFATIFWVVALGYWAALLYVLNYRLMRAEGTAAETRESARVLHTALFWIPGRLLVLCLGLAGDWHRVTRAVSGRLWDISETEPLLADALAAALDRKEQTPDSLQVAMDMLEAQQGLLLRCLALWLLLAAFWVLLVT